MKIKDGFMLREIAGSWIVVPIGQRVVEFNGLISLNESGAMLWRAMEQGQELDGLVASIRSEYEVDEATAKADVQEFISKMNEKGLLI